MKIHRYRKTHIGTKIKIKKTTRTDRTKKKFDVTDPHIPDPHVKNYQHRYRTNSHWDEN